MTSLEELRFDNRAIKSLPVEEERENYTRSVSGTVHMNGVFIRPVCFCISSYYPPEMDLFIMCL